MKPQTEAVDQLLREVRLARAEFTRELANARAEFDAEVGQLRAELEAVRQELHRWRAIGRFRDGTDAEPTWMHWTALGIAGEYPSKEGWGDLAAQQRTEGQSLVRRLKQIVQVFDHGPNHIGAADNANQHAIT